LADFIAPVESELHDYIGMFAVTAGVGVDKLVAEYEAKNDDYNAILVKALADRLAEAFAEYCHQQMRLDCGFADSEDITSKDLIKERYRGIRPAPGYPACPDHTDKGPLFELLGVADSTAMKLTESFAVSPAASVSGFYFNHPASRYFGVGLIGKDQIQSLAQRKGISVEECERWMAPSLGY
jgi:5-methyltetrahydrofolate--homocysteine methyltransferase